ncbi:MAG: hypothetical protein RMY28_009630 [Nostoc sp. ChiSLP01]|nr:hypothetical protein [Nostoc sp. CmiSLP01]MDZ8285185.1 hypothetical protein [Nostoc sp. ChiSLP01]
MVKRFAPCGVGTHGDYYVSYVSIRSRRGCCMPAKVIVKRDGRWFGE